MTQNEKNGGKGLTRTEIARRAYLAADAKAQAALRRLRQAEANDAKRAVREAGSKDRAIEKAKALLRKNGIRVAA